MINLARKHVLSETEFLDAVNATQWVTLATWYRIWDLKGENVVMLPITFICLTSTAIFDQQGLSPKEQFAVHAKGLVGATGSWISPGRSDLYHTVQHV